MAYGRFEEDLGDLGVGSLVWDLAFQAFGCHTALPYGSK